MRLFWITLVSGVVALASGCGGDMSRNEGDQSSGKGPVFTVDVDGIGPTMVVSRSDAEKVTSCTVHERSRDVSITFASGNPSQACETWIENQNESGSEESWSATSSSSERKPACMFLVLRFGLVEVDAGENGSAVTQLCATLADDTKWIRFKAAEEAKKRGQAIPLVLDVPSASMEPTYHCARPAGGCGASKSDLLVTELVAPSELRRGDVVAFTAPRAAAVCGSPGDKWISRLVGLPGERWQERDGYVYIDGRRLAEAYVENDRRSAESLPERAIPTDEYVVLGDNRVQSCDSRRWGSLGAENIFGRVTEVLRPR